jgi:TnpA family transposase
MSIISILSPEEEKAFNKTPKFTFVQKEYYFKLPSAFLHTIDGTSNKIFFTLMYGYFKATNKFFEVNLDDENLLYLLKEEFKTNISVNIAERTFYRYKKIIREYFAINEYTGNIQQLLQKEALNLANNFVHRKKIFYSLVEFSKKLKIEIPNYRELVRIITLALNTQKKDILDKLESLVEDEKLNVLDEFLTKDQNYKNRYHLMHYKKLEHSTKKNQMTISLTKFNVIKSRFKITKNIMDSIGINHKIAEYYAKWIEKSQIFQVKRKKDLESNFLLLSFIYYQYLIRNDNLIDRFISTVQTAKNSSFRAQKEFSFEQEPHKNRVMQSLEDANLSTLNEIESVIKDNALSAIKKVSAIELLVEKKTTLLKHILSEKKIFETSTDNKYGFIEKKSVSLQGKLSGILKVIEFDEKTSNTNILLAINYFKNNPIITDKAPQAFLSDEEKEAIFNSGKFRVSLYKIILFFHVSDAIKSGILNLKYSYRYKDFDSYLLDKDEWNKNKDALLEMHELEHLKKFDIFIEPIKTKVEHNFKHTNENIKRGFNTYFTSTIDSFILKTPKLEKDEDESHESIAKYFPHDEYLSVVDVLDSINNEVNFLSSFQHYSQSKIKSNHNLLLASILGYGCNITLSKIGKISKGINENQLDNTKIWYFSEENTIEANDKIIACIDKLDIVKLMRNNQEINHTSSDGQKYSIKSSIDSTNAGHSSKYFGADKGVVSYTFIDESHKLFYSIVINVNERESGYVIDGLLHNETVHSDIHSTDSHGFSEVIFGLTNLLGFSFAPRIKNFKDQQLYGFNSPKLYRDLDYKLVPKRKINMELTSENWDDILRFIITIKERKTTVTQLLKRLSSYSKQHKLYAAIKEFGKIIKTDFLLTYIDDMELRQQIEKQLNKVESSNKFSKAVFFGNNSEFQVATVEEQNIANNSKRLIQNAVILWNYMYITKKLQQARNKTEKDEILKALKNSSIIHWSHINFYGEYDFTRSSKRIHNLIALDDTKEFMQSISLEKLYRDL